MLAEALVRFHPALGNPRLARRAAPRGMDEADGLLQFLMQLAHEKISHCAEVLRILRCRDFPFARAVVERRLAAFLRDGEDADVGKFRRCDFLVRVLPKFHGHLHVRLPARDPHFTDGDVLDGEFVFASDRHVHAGAGLEPFEFDAPFSGFVRSVAHGMRAERRGHFLAGIRAAPDVCFCVLEQDHVVADERGELHIGERGDAEAEECCKGGGESCHLGNGHEDWRSAARAASTSMEGEVCSSQFSVLSSQKMCRAMSGDRTANTEH